MSKKLIFLRGIPGSGKTTLANSLANAYKGIAVAADDYFYKDGEYKFSEKGLYAAYEQCFERTMEGLKNYDTVIVHNTSTTEQEVELFEQLAKDMGVEFISLVVENRHGSESVHGVADERKKEMALNLIQSISLTPGFKYKVETPIVEGTLFEKLKDQQWFEKK